MIALTCVTVQFSPAQLLFPPPGCSLYDSDGTIHDTAGISPARPSSTNVAGGFTFSHLGPERTCRIIWSAFIHAFSSA
jgi:hypothetical protein